MRYPFCSIQQSFKLQTSTHETKLFCTLHHPPEIFIKTIDPLSSKSHKILTRLVSLSIGSLHFTTFTHPETRAVESAALDAPEITRWVEHCYTFRADDSIKQMLACLKEFGLVLPAELEIVNPPACVNIATTDLPFLVRFKVLGMMSRGLFTEFSVDQELVDTLAGMEENIVVMLLSTLERKGLKVYEAANEVRREFENFERKVVKMGRITTKLEYNVRIVPRVVITPCKIYYEGPHLEIANRVIRASKRTTAIFHRIRCIINEGIDVAGRMAQCFSSTIAIGRISTSNIVMIKDIERVDPQTKHKYCFSDGVGMVGKFVANNLLSELKRHIFVNSSSVCAFQFRMSGCKGMLAVNPNIPESQIHIRPSQKKFEVLNATPTLEIIRTSFYSPGFLNRQFVLLLETLGVPKDVFLELKDLMVEHLDGMLKDEKEAINVLTGLPDEYGVSAMLVDMLQSNLFKLSSDSGEPFLINILRLYQALQVSLKDLKKKTRIYVPKSCNVLGILDETAKLPSGTIFLQYTNPKGKQRVVVEGQVLISRNPALHPGDIQLVNAVDIPELHYLFDVVVFSQNGERPLPDTLSGGDLDGDTFFVSWDSKLFPKKSYAPQIALQFKYEAIPPMPVTTQAIKTHFLNVLKHNHLGQIANAHQAHSDKSPLGALCPAALTLAELHNRAVDYPKNGGAPVLIPESLRVKLWPDFMERKNTYQSEKVIGEIYRSLHVEMKIVDRWVWDGFVVSGWEKFRNEAEVVCDSYERDILAVMNQFEISAELELISGYIFKMQDGVRKNKPHELKDQVMQAVTSIKCHYRKIFWNEKSWITSDDPILSLLSEFHHKNPFRKCGIFSQIPEQVKQKASACSEDLVVNLSRRLSNGNKRSSSSLRPSSVVIQSSKSTTSDYQSENISFDQIITKKQDLIKDLINDFAFEGQEIPNLSLTTHQQIISQTRQSQPKNSTFSNSMYQSIESEENLGFPYSNPSHPESKIERESYDPQPLIPIEVLEPDYLTGEIVEQQLPTHRNQQLRGGVQLQSRSRDSLRAKTENQDATIENLKNELSSATFRITELEKLMSKILESEERKQITAAGKDEQVQRIMDHLDSVNVQLTMSQKRETVGYFDAHPFQTEFRQKINDLEISLNEIQQECLDLRRYQQQNNSQIMNIRSDQTQCFDLIASLETNAQMAMMTSPTSRNFPSPSPRLRYSDTPTTPVTSFKSKLQAHLQNDDYDLPMSLPMPVQSPGVPRNVGVITGTLKNTLGNPGLKEGYREKRFSMSDDGYGIQGSNEQRRELEYISEADDDDNNQMLPMKDVLEDKQQIQNKIDQLTQQKV
ncbi:hypothetical protein HK096_007124, partial [Nowakowskiella sp. JEL0078]